MSTTIRKILADRPVHAVEADAPITQAAKLMAREGVGALAVVEGETLVGVLSERDIVFRGVAQDIRMREAAVREIMTPDPVVLGIDEAVSNALAAKLGDSFRHLPVMEEGRLAGMLSYRDIPHEYVMLFERFREMTASRADDL